MYFDPALASRSQPIDGQRGTRRSPRHSGTAAAATARCAARSHHRLSSSHADSRRGAGRRREGGVTRSVWAVRSFDSGPVARALPASLGLRPLDSHPRSMQVPARTDRRRARHTSSRGWSQAGRQRALRAGARADWRTPSISYKIRQLGGHPCLPWRRGRQSECHQGLSANVGRAMRFALPRLVPVARGVPWVKLDIGTLHIL